MNTAPASAKDPGAADPERREHERVLSLPFECLRSLPEGMSEVRLWYDPLLKCQRVGKRYDMSEMEGNEGLPEPSTLQAMKHNNVVPIVTAAYVSGYNAPMKVVELVTPFFERGSITDALLEGDRFSAREAVRIVQATLRGLAHIHEVHGICHRDVKSGNVLLCAEHVARVADLGVAGRFDEAGTVVAVNNPTLYSSPEFPSGVLTRASDIFSVGLILREVLGGPFPYADYPTSDIVSRLTKRHSVITAQDLELPVWASSSMRRVYAKATKRNPSERFQTAREMDEALSRALAVDWVEADGMRWEAPFIHQRHCIAVEAAPKPRLGLVRMTTLVNRGRGWRREGEPVDVANVYCSEARKVFNQASLIAAAR